MKRILACTVAAMAILAASSSRAMAQDDLELGRSGPYVGIGGTYALQEFSGNKPSPDAAWGYNLKGGYRFNRWFALQVDWTHLPTFKASSGDIESWAADVGGKFLPFDGIVQPFAAVGIGWHSADDNRFPKTSETGLGFRFAGGVDVYVSRNFAITAEVAYLMATGGVSSYDSLPLSLGVMYRFY